MKDYYSNPEVRARMYEFLGGDGPQNVTCEYITAGDAFHSLHRVPLPVSELHQLLDQDPDISRSLWDHRWLVADLDIEYVNFDFPLEPYVEPSRIFALQRPVELAAEAVFLDYSIRPLRLLSGRGHHFVWQIAQDSPAFERLAALGRAPPSLEALNARPHRPDGNPVPPKLGAAFAGLALVMEFLAHRIKEEAALACKIPVEITAVEVGPSRAGREMISIDISEYGDPLSARVIRVPFSHYLKPWQQRGVLGDEIVKGLSSIFLIPLQDMDLERGLHAALDEKEVLRLAARVSTKIPDESVSMEELVGAYEDSSLKKFHDWYYAEEHHPRGKWPETYDLAPLDQIPLCARLALERPNDLLLRPANIERVTRVMLSLGWHPRHIAGLIRSKFERDHGWGESWKGYDPATRADFYTRLFSGLFVTGRDDLVDFNCQSVKEEKLCTAAGCPFNLEHYKQSLLDRRKYERLARRPFNRLFLPKEHL